MNTVHTTPSSHLTFCTAATEGIFKPKEKVKEFFVTS